MDDSVLKQLSDVIETRKSMPAEKTYVASLHHKGLNKILEKVSEESAETIPVSYTHLTLPTILRV